MCTCSVCGDNKSPFVMNNKLVCLRCDELLFDIEVECDEQELGREKPKQPLQSGVIASGTKSTR